MTAKRLPGGPHSAQPAHLSFLHSFFQGFVLVAHEGWHTRGDGAVVMGVAVHGEHPLQQNHEHLNDQLSELCAQKDLHSLTCVVGVLVVVVAESVVVVAVTGGAVTGGAVTGGASVGAGPGMHWKYQGLTSRQADPSAQQVDPPHPMPPH